MADTRYLIDIILNARDNTSQAIQGALKGLQGLEKQQEQLKRETDELSRKYREAFGHMAQSEDALRQQRAKLNATTQEQVELQQKLVDASQKYARQLNEFGRGSRQAVIAYGQMIDAEKSLVKAYDDREKNLARANAALLKNTAVTEEQARIQKRIAEEVAQAEAQAAQKRIQVQQALGRQRIAEEEETARKLQAHQRAMNLQRLAEEEEASAKLAAHQRAMNIQRLEEEEEADRKLIEHKRAMGLQRLNEEEEMEQRRIASMRSLALQRLREEDEAERRLSEHRMAMIRQRFAEEEAAHDEALRMEEQRNRDRLAREREFQATMRQLQDARRRAATGRAEGAPEDIQQRLDLDVSQFETKLAAVAQQMRALDGSEIDINVELRTANFMAEAERVKRTQRDLNDGNMTLLGSFGALFDGVEGGSNRIAAFDNLIRGLFTLLITVFLQNLIQVGAAAVGMLGALASSAMTAGAALGGALVAGIAQAVPALGILGTALSRVKGVLDAVKQANLLQQQQSYQGAQQANREASAVDQVRNAQEALADAQRRVADAQERLTMARTDARRQLRDLILAEREAELAAKGAALSQEESQRALARAVAEGRSTDVAGAQLGVEQADLGAARAGRRLTTTRREATAMRAGGVEGAEGVQRAKEGLRDAERAVVQAERSLQRARRSASQAEAGITAAGGKLNYLMSQMSGAERRMFEAIMRLSTVWRGFAQDAAEPLINSFTRAIRRVTGILQMPEMIQSARRLSSRMAGAFDRVFDAFTSPAALRDFRTFADEAGKNMRPLSQIVINLGRAFRNIAIAAGPALRDILKWIRQITGDLGRMTSEGRRSGKLAEFFQDGVKHLKSWADLMYQIVRLFAAIAGAGGAEEGKRAVDDMADSIGKAADKIGKAGSAANEFWRDFFRTSRRIMDELGPIFTAIGDEFRKTFNQDAVGATRGFATLMAEVLIPAIGNFIRTIGRAVQSVGEFVQAHPWVGKLSAAFIGLALTMGTVGKVFGLFAPVTALFKNLWGLLTKGADEGKKLATAFGRIGSGLKSVRGFLLGPGGLVILFGMLLAKLGLLDDVARIPLRFIKGLLEQIMPPIRRLIASFQDLFDAIGEGKGVFAVLRPLLSIIIKIVGYFVEGFGRSIGKVIGGFIDVISGMVEIVTGLLTGDFRKAWEGIKRIVGGALRAVWGVIEVLLLRGILGIIRGAVSSVIGLFGRMGRGALDVLKSGFSGVFNFFKNLPGTLWNFVKEIPSKLASAFKETGPKVLKAILAGFAGAATNVAGVGKDIINALIDLLNMAIPNKIPTFGPDIPLPDNPIPKLAKGGRIPGYGGGDRIPALLEPGEHVWTKEEVARAGGHGVLFALRRLLGGGGQGGPFGYQRGGEARGGGAASVTIQSNIGDFGAGFASAWRAIITVTRRSSNEVARQFRQLRVGVEATMNRLSREFHERWRRMIPFALDASKDIWMGVRRNVMNLQTTVFRGMSYVSQATNKALRSFDADPINLQIPRPSGGPEGRAVGGFIGKPGERGRDAIWALLGRGEAVLNHWQQRAVQSFLPPGVSLHDLIERTRGYHAGGPGAPGFAGGYSGKIPGNGQAVSIPGQPGEYIAKRIAGAVVKMMRRYKMAVTDGFATSGHSANSDHYKGLAADFVPGPGGNWNLVDKAAAYAKSKLGSVFRWIGYDGTPGHGRGHHLHLSWLSDAQGLGAMALAAIKRILVKGAGPLKDIAQGSLDKVRKAANRLLEGQMDSGIMEAHPTGAVLGRGQVMSVINRAMEAVGVPESLRAAWRSMAYDRARQESGFNPNAQNNWDINAKNGDPSRGLFQTIGATFRSYMLPGMNNILHPLHNAVAAFRYMFGRYGGGENWNLALQRMLGLRGVGYATGGVIPGDYEGAPQPILAHAGEWVVNKGQQMKLAAMAGLPIAKIRAALGFSGGPTSFQGGGEVMGGPGRFFSVAMLREWEQHERRMGALKGKNNADERRAEERRHREKMAAIRKEEAEERRRFARMRPEQQRMAQVRRGAYNLDPTPSMDFSELEQESNRAQRASRNLLRRAGGRLRGALLDRFMKNVNAVLGDGGVLDQMRDAIDRTAARLETDLNLARAGLRRVRQRVGRRIVDRLVRMPQLTDEAAIATRQRQGSEQLLGMRMDTRRETVQGLQGVEEQMRRMQRGGISRGEQARYQRLVAARREFLNSIDELDSQIAQIQEQVYTDRREEFEKQTAAALRPGEATQRWGEVIGRVQSILGHSGNILNHGIQVQIAGMQQQINVLNQRAAEAAKAGYADLAADYRQQATDLAVSVLEAQQQILQNGLDEINNAAERAMNDLERRRRRAIALGDSSKLVGFMDEQRKIITDQNEQLKDALKQAQAAGNVGLAQQIQDQIADNDTALVELAAERLATLTEQSAKAFERSMASIDRRMRVAEALGRTDTVAALMDQRLEAQRARATQLAGEIRDAQAAGNVGLAEQLQDTLDDLNAEIADGVIAQFNFAVEQVNRAADRRQTAIEIRSRIATALGQQGVLAGLYQQRIDSLNQQLTDLGPLLAQAQAAGNQGAVETLTAQIADLQAQIIEQTAAQLQNAVEQVGQGAARAQAVIDIRRRVASALGQSGALQSLYRESITVLERQIEGLQGLLTQALAQGNEGVAQQITDQIRDLQTQITELAAQELAGALEIIQTAAQRREAGLSLRERMAALMQAGGNALGAAQSRLGILQDRRANIGQQRNELYGLLAQAQAQGNTGLVQQLTDAIEELDMALAENSQAISDQTVAIRQVSIDLITARQQFQGGVSSSLQNIINAVGTLTGQLNLPALIAQVERMGNLLAQTGSGLREQLLEGFGIDLTGQAGMSLVAAINAMNFDELTGGMTEAQVSQFQALINAILENEQAVLQNTQQLNELNGNLTQPQSWQSTSWQWFRNAIFSGMGDVLPQFQVPQMQTGGYVTKSGLFNLHQGEFVVNPERSNVPAGDDIDINIYEAGRPIDLTHLANRLAFAKKGAGGS